MVLAPVEDFSTGRIDRDKPEWVKRFHDMYHNEALVARFGFKDKEWADRLMFNMTYSQNYKDMQTGVRQEARTQECINRVMPRSSQARSGRYCQMWLCARYLYPARQ